MIHQTTPNRIIVTCPEAEAASARYAERTWEKLAHWLGQHGWWSTPDFDEVEKMAEQAIGMDRTRRSAR